MVWIRVTTENLGFCQLLLLYIVALKSQTLNKDQKEILKAVSNDCCAVIEWWFFKQFINKNWLI